jgi:predicted nucleotidyltransferase
MVYYHAKHSHPAFEDLKHAFLKTVGVGDYLRALLHKHRRHLDLAWIFGSVARGEEGADSDIDMILVSDHSLLQLSKVIGPLSRRIRRELNVVFLSPQEVQKKFTSNDYFISDIIRKPKIWLVGNDQKLERIVSGTPSQVASPN